MPFSDFGEYRLEAKKVKKVVMLVLATVIMVAMAAPPAMAAPQQPHPSAFLFVERERSEMQVWWKSGFVRLATERPLFVMGLGNEEFVSNELLELVGLKVFPLPGNTFLFTAKSNPWGWIWAHTTGGEVIQARSSFGDSWVAKEHGWLIRWEELGLPMGKLEGLISFDLFQFLLSQLGIGGASLLPMISPSGEIVEKGAIWIWLWSSPSLPLPEKG